VSTVKTGAHGKYKAWCGARPTPRRHSNDLVLSPSSRGTHYLLGRCADQITVRAVGQGHLASWESDKHGDKPTDHTFLCNCSHQIGFSLWKIPRQAAQDKETSLCLSSNIFIPTPTFSSNAWHLAQLSWSPFTYSSISQFRLWSYTSPRWNEKWEHVGVLSCVSSYSNSYPSSLLSKSLIVQVCVSLFNS
jgi:hypothetical protein